MPNPGTWFDESEHPRAGKGTPTGGQFVSKGGGEQSAPNRIAVVMTLPNGARINALATKIHNENETVRVWHATLTPEYKPTAGAHFGTHQAATQRVKDLMELPPESRPVLTPRRPQPTLHEVELKLGKVVELKDPGEWWPGDIAAQLHKNGVMSQKEYTALESKEFDFDPVEYLRDKGYDTIAYNNEMEDKGTYSYIPLREENIHYLSKGVFVPNYKPGIHAIHDRNKIAETKASWILDSPIRTLDQALDAGPKAQSELAEVADEVSRRLGITFSNPGPKNKTPEGVERIKEKIELRGSIAAVTDIARGTFIINHPTESETIAEELGKRFEVVLEDWRKNEQGYMDRSAMVRFEDGLIGEIQFMDAGMAKAKSDKGGHGHDMYVEWRGIDKSTPKGQAQADALEAKMIALYHGVTSAYSAEWKALLGRAGT